MFTPLLTALAKFVAAIGSAVMAFRDLRNKQSQYDADKAAKKAAKEAEQK